MGCSEPVADGGFPHLPQCPCSAVSHCSALWPLCFHSHLVSYRWGRPATEPYFSGGASGVECVVHHCCTVSAGRGDVSVRGTVASAL